MHARLLSECRDSASATTISPWRAEITGQALLAATHSGALANLDPEVTRAVISIAMRAYQQPGTMLPTKSGLKEQVVTVRNALKADAASAEPEAIEKFLILFARRRGLDVPCSEALAMDAAVMSQWPADLMAKAARSVWERFAEMRVPNPPDFRAFIEADLAERVLHDAALHTLEKRLETVERTGRQLPQDRADGGGTADFI